MLGLLQELNAQNITIVLVTHEHDIAACAKRVVSMRDGKVQSDTVSTERIIAREALAALPPLEDHA